jgi:retron-type reverse transcriptase
VDALAVELWRQPVNGVLDADIWDFFETLDQGWLTRFMEHRLADRRLVRLIQKWLHVGVMENGTRVCRERETVQGGNFSPLLTTLYLHEVFDCWGHEWRQPQAQGHVVVVRHADDFIVGVEHRVDAERFLTELRTRFATYGLKLHPDKTRLIEFGRDAT